MRIKKLHRSLLLFLLLILCFSKETIAQFPNDTNYLAPIDSVFFKDSIRKYTIAHLDTSLFILSKRFNPTPFYQNKKMLPIQVELVQDIAGIGFLIFPIILLLALIILVKLRYKDYFDVLFKNTFRINTSATSRDWSDLNAFGSFLLNIVYVVVCSVYIFSLTIFFKIHFTVESSFQIFSIILIAFTIYYVSRLLALKILGQLSSKNHVINAYISQTSTINQFTSLCVLPLLIFMQTGGQKLDIYLIIFIAIIYLISQLLKYFKGLVAGIQELSHDFFHFIVYICTIEIAPVLIIVKLALNFLR